MISGMLGYKWVVKGAKWSTAALFGLVVMIVDGIILFIIRNMSNWKGGFFSFLVLGLAAYLVAKFWKGIAHQKSLDIAIKTVIVSVLISLVLLALIGLMFISILGGLILNI